MYKKTGQVQNESGIIYKTTQTVTAVLGLFFYNWYCVLRIQKYLCAPANKINQYYLILKVKMNLPKERCKKKL